MISKENLDRLRGYCKKREDELLAPMAMITSGLLTSFGVGHDIDERASLTVYELRELIDTIDELDGQIERLAKFIMEEVTGEPSTSDGAVDVAIRVMRGGWKESMVDSARCKKARGG